MLNGPTLEARASNTSTTTTTTHGAARRAPHIKTDSFVGAAPPLNVAVFQQSHSTTYATFTDDGKPQPTPSQPHPQPQRRMMFAAHGSAGSGISVVNSSLTLHSASSASALLPPPAPVASSTSSFTTTTTPTGPPPLASGASALSVTATPADLSSTPSLLPPPADVVLSGVLWKRGHFFKTWLSRHFVLSKVSLSYYRKNPFAFVTSTAKSAKASDNGMRKLLRGEIFRSDVLRVEVADGFKSRPFCFVVVVRKRTRRSSNATNAFTCLPSSCRTMHEKETSLMASDASSGSSSNLQHNKPPIDDEPVVLYYIQAASDAERQKWLKTLTQWIHGDVPTKIGRRMHQYIVSNEYSNARFEQKTTTDRLNHSHPPLLKATSSSSSTTGDGAWVTSSSLSPASQAGRRVEMDFPVLANLIRDLHECIDEDEMVYILDQILGEVADGASTSSIKKLIATAGEVKLETTPAVWTTHVKRAYATIMKALRTTQHASKRSLNQRRGGGGVGSRPSPLASASATERSRTYAAASGATHSLLPPASQRPQVETTMQPTPTQPQPHLQLDKQQSCSVMNAADSPANALSFHKFYKLGRKLGSGAFSVVHIATHRETRKQVAVKCIAKTSLADLDARALQQEVAIMKELDHPNVVPLLDYFEASRYYFIVTPLCTGGELFDDLVKRKTYTEDDARVLMKKLASAIQYLHARGIVHRDLKPENILLKTTAPGAEVMVADFGFARSMTSARRGTACGTPGYVAPEVVQGRPYGAAVDCWSLGVILFILLCGYPPFPGATHKAILDKVVHAKYEFEAPFWDFVSVDAKDLVRRLLTVDPTQRLAAADVLQHPWVIGSSSLHEQRSDTRRNCYRSDTRVVDCGGDCGDCVEDADAAAAAAGCMDQAAADDDDDDNSNNEEKRALLTRVLSTDLRPALLQMRKHSLTHENPKIRPSDMHVDALALLSDVATSEDEDVELLDRELGKIYAF